MCSPAARLLQVHMLGQLALAAMPSCVNAAGDVMPIRSSIMPTDQKQRLGCTGARSFQPLQAAGLRCRSGYSGLLLHRQQSQRQRRNPLVMQPPRQRLLMQRQTLAARQLQCQPRQKRQPCSARQPQQVGWAHLVKAWPRSEPQAAVHIPCAESPCPSSRWRNAGELSMLQCSHANLSISMGTPPVLGGQQGPQNVGESILGRLCNSHRRAAVLAGRDAKACC